MKLIDLINELQKLHDEVGDAEVILHTRVYGGGDVWFNTLETRTQACGPNVAILKHDHDLHGKQIVVISNVDGEL